MNSENIRTIAVIGAGLMGHGIAQEFAVAGYSVCMHDVSDEALQTALSRIRNNLRMLADLGLVTGGQIESGWRNIRTGTELRDAVAEADLVIEAVSEDLHTKQAIFRSLDQYCPARTILASNTSTLLPSKLASATQRADRVLVTHYFNPPYLLPIVEIVRHERTSDDTVAIVYELLKKLGKSPVIVQKEIPGFIGNRLQAALFREALSIVQRGLASPQDVDLVIKNGFGRRFSGAGIFEVWEIAGWDLISAVCKNLFPELDASAEISPVLRTMVDRGDLGVKTGKGFYEWTPDSARALRERIAHMLTAVAREARVP